MFSSVKSKEYDALSIFDKQAHFNLLFTVNVTNMFVFSFNEQVTLFPPSYQLSFV